MAEAEVASEWDETPSTRERLLPEVALFCALPNPPSKATVYTLRLSYTQAGYIR
jgi:hypothetical protein